MSPVFSEVKIVTCIIIKDKEKDIYNTTSISTIETKSVQLCLVLQGSVQSLHRLNAHRVAATAHSLSSDLVRICTVDIVFPLQRY